MADSNPLACDRCGYVAKAPQGLAAHKRAKHVGIPKVTCPHCGYETTASGLTRHIKGQHSNTAVETTTVQARIFKNKPGTKWLFEHTRPDGTTFRSHRNGYPTKSEAEAGLKRALRRAYPDHDEAEIPVTPEPKRGRQTHVTNGSGSVKRVKEALAVLFPKGIQIDDLDAVNEWVEMTTKLTAGGK